MVNVVVVLAIGFVVLVIERLVVIVREVVDSAGLVSETLVVAVDVLEGVVVVIVEVSVEGVLVLGVGVSVLVVTVVCDVVDLVIVVVEQLPETVLVSVKIQRFQVHCVDIARSI